MAGDLPAAWIGPGIPGIMDCDGTYCETPLEALPAVVAPDDLTWLKPLDPRLDVEMSQFRPGAKHRENYTQRARRILTQAASEGIALPAAFVDLVQSELLQDRFPSATACYFDLPAMIAAAPFGLDGSIIRFLNDQQACVLWYLHLPAQGMPRVLASGPNFLEELPADDADLISEALAATRVVSSSFSEFLYRYWIENSVWLKNSLGIELAEEETAYVEAARVRFRR